MKTAQDVFYKDLEVNLAAHRVSRAGHELCLAAASIGGRVESSCSVVRRGKPLLCAQNVQTKVNARGGTGRGEHLALIYEEHTLVHLNLRESLRERGRVVPVGGRPFAIEQTGLGERECAG